MPWPVELSDARFTENSIGTPVVRVAVKNVTEATFDDTALTFYPFSDGEPLAQDISGDKSVGVQDDDDLAPGDSTDIGYEFFGWERAEVVVIAFRSVTPLEEDGLGDFEDFCMDEEFKDPHCLSLVACAPGESTCEDPRDGAE